MNENKLEDSKGFAALLRLVRPKQWIKNGFIFLPLFFGGALLHADALLAGLEEETLHALYASAAPTVRRRIARWASSDRARRAPVTGDDLVAIGLSGPAVGRALARVRAAWLDGALESRDEALALALEVSRRRGRR